MGRNGFNPRPRGGANSGMIRTSLTILTFQSTPPWGGERENASVWPAGHAVSIHAPVGGRTRRNRIGVNLGLSFNPRPRGGANRSCRIHGGKRCRFQSTPPWGGERVAGPVQFVSQYVSIHAPVGGRTASWCRSLGRSTCFNPRPRGGANYQFRSGQRRTTGFNPRPRGGVNAQ